MTTPVTATLQPERWVGSNSSTSKATTLSMSAASSGRPGRSHQDALIVEPEADGEVRRQRPRREPDAAERGRGQEAEALVAGEDLQSVPVDFHTAS
ncbi:MAG: hypothetical protein WKF43_12575 [Acidimicrobiales bacterium]